MWFKSEYGAFFQQEGVWTKSPENSKSVAMPSLMFAHVSDRKTFTALSFVAWLSYAVAALK